MALMLMPRIPNPLIISKNKMIEVKSTKAKLKLPESERLLIMSQNERPYWERRIAVAGMDEVGRGPLAGPVVAACVMMPPYCLIEGVNDSKKLSKKKLELLHGIIIDKALAYGVGFVDEKTIDEINILQATKLAFKHAFESMLEKGVFCGTVFVDAVKELDISADQHPIIHGDAVCYSIAAASIVAKVERDRFMVKMAEKYPQYGFEKNVGYGTKQHIEALKQYGSCEIHRRSFIKNFVD